MDEFDAINEKLQRFIAEFQGEFVSRVENRTPVQSGNLRNNWVTTSTQGGFELTNRMEYASAVEFGTSKMEPRGMIRTTLEEAEVIAEAALRKVNLK